MVFLFCPYGRYNTNDEGGTKTPLGPGCFICDFCECVYWFFSHSDDYLCSNKSCPLNDLNKSATNHETPK